MHSCRFFCDYFLRFSSAGESGNGKRGRKASDIECGNFSASHGSSPTQIPSSDANKDTDTFDSGTF